MSPIIKRERGPILPPPPCGTEAIPPAEWANYIKALSPFYVKEGAFPRTAALARLVEMPLVRELLLKPQSNYSASGLANSIRMITRKAESAFLFVVGEEMDLKECACSRCKRGMGPFALCVRLEGIPWLTACAGCHWHMNDKKCNFYRPLPEISGWEPELFPDSTLFAKINQVGSAVSKLSKSVEKSSSDMEEAYEAASELLALIPGPTESAKTMISTMAQSRSNDIEVTKDLQSLVQAYGELTSSLQEPIKAKDEETGWTGHSKRPRIS
ncbi:hypothetical protein N7456_007418 [Penicillium angulare]|uniref:Uncharacterized protein n=1 Tax=Penicillium angulare TaxID=116970 RepID=A0A9W9FB35_9EURO|nr:hypothetical protein N7456_007418 [Penicillium angulare]